MNKKIIMICLLVIMWACFIFVMSSMDTNESNGKSKHVITVAIEKTLKITNSLGITDKHLTKEELNNIVAHLNKPLRKCVHASVYFILSILVYSLLSLCKISRWKNCILSLILSFWYACTDEFHQLFVDGRTGQFIDVLIDTAGAIIGIIVINIIFSIINKIKNNKKEAQTN